MRVIDAILGEDNSVKSKFLHDHEKDDADPDLHLPNFLFLGARDQLRLDLQEHYAEEPVEDANVARNDDPCDDEVVEDADEEN